MIRLKRPEADHTLRLNLHSKHIGAGEFYTRPKRLRGQQRYPLEPPRV
jgi:hypothetical protein